MSEHRFERTRPVAASPQLAANFFRAADAWFRLNPEWEVLSFDGFVLRVRYERSEAEAEWQVVVHAAAANGIAVTLDGPHPRRIELNWESTGDGALLLSYGEAFDQPVETARIAELNLWLDAAAGYLALAARRDRRARFGKWLLDKAWLRMSPASRRVGLIVFAMEALALLLFIAVVIVYKIAG